jgi:trk system potassium uptake protein TrkH
MAAVDVYCRGACAPPTVTAVASRRESAGPARSGTEPGPGGRTSNVSPLLAESSGALAAAVPAPIAVASWLPHGLDWPALPWNSMAGIGSALCLAASSVLIVRTADAGRWLAVIGIAAGVVGTAELLADSPTIALVVLIGAILAMGRLWAPRTLFGRLFHLAHPSLDVARARGAAVAATVLWLAISLRGAAPSIAGQACMAASFLVAWALVGRWLRRERRTRRLRTGVVGVVAAVAVLAAIQASLDGGVRIDALVLLPAMAAVALPVLPRQGLGRVDWWEPVLGHPARFLVVTFAALCLGGTVVLALPVSAASGQGLPLLDAAFTAVSAVCVTGLTVLDTPSVFAPFGQAAIAALIQLGGLGIMTFSTAAMRLFGQRMSLRYEGMVASMMSAQDRGRLHDAARQILVLTAATEAIGALLLAALFWQHGDPLGQALWRGLFTAISAFCNAGFALQTTNLMPYQAEPAVLHVVGLLIIAGSLSPAAVAALPDLLGQRGRVGVQIKLALVTTAVLLAGGAVLVLAMEWDNTLAPLSVLDRIHNAWFQSITLRTAGFNSIDLTALRPETLSIMIIWMFIGGNPGSTAGGIKTVTAAVMFLAVVAAIRGRSHATAFGRRITHKSVYRAAAVATLGVVIVLSAFVALQVTQAMSSHLAIFEVVSALATVGLTIGATPLLDEVGKVIIMGCMFMGRVGPLTLFMFLQQQAEPVLWERPEQDIDVG